MSDTTRAAAVLPTASALVVAKATAMRDALRRTPPATPSNVPLATYQEAVAALFAKAPPIDPAVVASYETFMVEAHHQFDAMREAGIVVEFCDDDPTPISPKTGRISYRLFVEEVNATGVLKVYRSLDADHPILGAYHLIHNGRAENFNSVFRSVHDWYGHLASGGRFMWKGETIAFYSHASMFSPHAQEALFSETVAQQCWYAVHGDYAPQKCVRYTREWQTPPLE